MLMVNTTFAQDTLFVKQLSYIDSSALSFQMGVRPLIVDDSNTASFFYISRGNTADTLFLTTSNNSGQNWSTREIVSGHVHINNNGYYAQGPTATIDDDGYFHVIYPYRGAPIYYPSFSNYPPNHINYATNESGNWVTSVDVINDSTIQASEGNASTVSYLYWPAMLSLNNMENLATYDYAWFSTKSHVVYSERDTTGIWTEGSALVTYERGVKDKYTIYTSTIVTDATNIHSLWFNRYTGELKSKTNSAGVWGAEEVIHTSPYAIDGVATTYSMSAISGSGKSQVVMSRMENASNYNELFFTEYNGDSWSVDAILISDTTHLVTAYEKNDTTNIFYRYYTQNDTRYGYKFLTHTADGFSNTAVLSFNDNNNTYQLMVAEHQSDPLIYQYYDKDKAMYYLCSGEIGELVISDVEEFNNNRPANYSLKQNFPNPFNPETTIQFHVPETGKVTIKIFNVLGQIVKTLVDEIKLEGSYSVKWNGKDENGKSAVSGIYIYQMIANGYKTSKKMITLK